MRDCLFSTRVMAGISFFCLWFSAAACSGSGPEAEAPQAEPPSPAQSEEWEILFDGTTTEKWRSFKGSDFPSEGWIVEDRCLKNQGGGKREDIITRGQFGDFVLELDYKIAPRGNSGIIYRVTEAGESTWHTGPEMQILDDYGFLEDGLETGDDAGVHTAGSIYDLVAPARRAIKTAGKLNHVRLVVRGAHVQHWINGIKIIDCELDSEEMMRRIAESKFKIYPEFAKASQGHIALQNHGNDVWFCNIRIRRMG